MTNLIRVMVDGAAKDFDSLEAAKTAYPDGEYLVVTDQSPAANAAIAAKIVRQREWRDSELTRTDVLSLLADHPQKTEIAASKTGIVVNPGSEVSLTETIVRNAFGDSAIR